MDGLIKDVWLKGTHVREFVSLKRENANATLQIRNITRFMRSHRLS